MLRNIILGAGVFAALFAILLFSGRLPIGKTNESPKGDVYVWGTLPETSIAPILQSFNPQAKTYRVNYREVREDNFSNLLLEALANGAGPDAIIASHQLILSQASRLYSFPLASFPEKKFRDTYVDGASIFLTPSGAIALPIAIDPMVLFYNRRIFSQKGIVTPPAYWDEVTNLVPMLTQISDKGRPVQSGIALGAATTPYAKDILMAIVSQLGQVPTLKQYGADGVGYISMTANQAVVQGGDVYPLATALRFFTQFADPAKTTFSWDDYSGRASEQFVAENLAMYIGRASEFGTLKAQNPKADFDMTYLPQTRGYNTFTTGAQLYGMATLRTSKNLVATLTAEAEFTGAGVAPSIAATIGAPPALRSYSLSQGLGEVTSRSMLIATPWYDSFSAQSTALATTMIADVVSGRTGVNEAATSFVNRLQDLYTPR